MHRKAEVAIAGGETLVCCSAPDLAIHVGDLCVVEQGTVPEFGRVATLEEVEGDMPSGRHVCRILRRATLQDQARADENAVRSKMALDSCVARAAGAASKMRFLRVRYSFDRAVLHVLFATEENIDTKEMARDLARDLRTHVEMKQIGVRDQAGIVGGLAPCGRKLCCCTWLRQFESINVKMAKTQGLSLNPASMSGMCGRLKCCLRYEYDLYRDLARCVPRQGACVVCPSGEGVVVGRSILQQRVTVQLDGDGVVECGAGDVVESWARNPRGGRDKDEGTRSERPEPEPAGDEGTGDLWPADPE